MFFSSLVMGDVVKVENVIGKAQYRKISETSWHTLKINQKLDENYRIRTGKGSKIILAFKDGSKITLRNMVVMDLKKIVNTPTAKQSSLKLFYGKIKASVKKLQRKNDYFEVYTPTAVIGVRGTEFGVSVRQQKKTRMAVFEGEVSVKNVEKKKDVREDKGVIVKTGQATVIEKDETPEKPKQFKDKSFDDWAARLEEEEKNLKDDYIKW